MIQDTGKVHVCPHRIAGLLDNRIRRWLQPPDRILGPYLASGQTVLDLGCGPGFFTLAMARRVGPKGRVYAIDLQMPMLTRVGRKAAAKGLEERVHLHQCRPDRIGLAVRADFALAYYMIHETPSATGFLREVFGMVRPSGHLLAVEPRLHVRRAAFEKMCRTGREIGWQEADRPLRKGGYGVLFRRP